MRTTGDGVFGLFGVPVALILEDARLSAFDE